VDLADVPRLLAAFDSDPRAGVQLLLRESGLDWADVRSDPEKASLKLGRGLLKLLRDDE
jgi:hypothetical protein